MKILIVPSWYPTEYKPIGGIFFKEQAMALQKYGHDVTVIFPELWSLKTWGKHKEKKGTSYSMEDGVKTYRYRGYFYYPRVPYAQGAIFYRRLKRLYGVVEKEQGKPDLIHAHSCLWGGVAAAKLAKAIHVPFLITEHSSAFGRKLIKPYQKRLIRQSLNQAGGVVVVGPRLKEELAHYIDQEKIMIIPNIVNIDYFKINADVQKGSEKSFRFFSLAFSTFNKGMDILLKAFAQSFKEEDVELVIGGDGKDRKMLVELAVDLGIAQQVIFLGKLTREEVVEQMQRCDAFVLASRYETFGVVFIEALACGKPIIATTCGGPEMIVNEQNGLLVPVEDVQALSCAMEQMRDEHGKYNPKEIRADCEERFGEEAVVRKIEKVYDSVKYNH